ncbi:leucine-rich repeat domain-containing protein [Flavobacterium sp. W22_SRS_FK3]|uniref:leucine-rich repeat domain-containing protein n=1 Tax=Flavobacterium sp. W22_SRS_FK3 TaxID=3240275 RepID=UPI003F90F143
MMRNKISKLPAIIMKDREVLEDLFKCNPANTIGKSWCIYNPYSDIRSWRGVSVDADGRVFKLDLGGCDDNGNSLFNLNVLPASIGNLEQLKILYLHSNKLSDLPSELGNLRNLTELGLSSNQLKVIPEDIGNLTQLKYLYLYSNELKTIPQKVFDLEKTGALIVKDDEVIYI